MDLATKLKKENSFLRVRHLLVDEILMNQAIGKMTIDADVRTPTLDVELNVMTVRWKDKRHENKVIGRRQEDY